MMKQNEDEEETKTVHLCKEENVLQPFSFQKPLKAGSEDNENEMITAFLPDFQDDDLGSMDISGFGDPDTFSLPVPYMGSLGQKRSGSTLISGICSFMKQIRKPAMERLRGMEL